MSIAPLSSTAAATAAAGYQVLQLTGATGSISTGAVSCALWLRLSITHALFTAVVVPAAATAGTVSVTLSPTDHVTSGPRLHLMLAFAVAVWLVDTQTAVDSTGSGTGRDTLLNSLEFTRLLTCLF
jgi:hypothetical protein